MTLNKIEASSLITSAPHRGNYNSVLRQIGRNMIRQLQDRSVVFSADGGECGEAYIDSNGRLNSVDTGNTTAIFDTDKYTPGFTDEAAGDTTHDPDGVTNPGNFFDGNDSTYAIRNSGAVTSYTTYLGKTFSSKFVGPVRIKADAQSNDQPGTESAAVYLETYDGATWNAEATLATGTLSALYDSIYILDKTVQGIRIKLVNSTTGGPFIVSHLFYTLEYGAYSTGEIHHTIPTGTFSSTISSCIGVPLVADFESGAGIDYKLQSFDWSSINQNSYVEISATIINKTELEINGCLVGKKSDGVWILGNTDSDDEIARAKIYQTLFYGTDGTDPRVVSGITNITSLKTSVSRDVGKRCHYASMIYSGTNNTCSYTGTFANTSTNTNCSSWSNLINGFPHTLSWQLPSGTTLNSVTNGSNNEIGTDTSLDETDNPANCKLNNAYTSSGDDHISKALILCVGDISWSSSGVSTFSNTDFFADYSIPDMTAAATLPTGQDDTGWLSTNEISHFTAFASEPTKCIVRLTPKSTSPAPGYPAIYGFSLFE